MQYSETLRVKLLGKKEIKNLSFVYEENEKKIHLATKQTVKVSEEIITMIEKRVAKI